MQERLLNSNIENLLSNFKFTYVVDDLSESTKIFSSNYSPLYDYDKLITKKRYFKKNDYLKDQLSKHKDFMFLIVPEVAIVKSGDYSEETRVMYTLKSFETWIQTEFGKRYFKKYGKSGFGMHATNVLYLPLNISNAFNVHLRTRSKNKNNYIS